MTAVAVRNYVLRVQLNTLEILVNHQAVAAHVIK